MSTSISVDVINEFVHADWVDDKGDVTTDIPAGAQITISTSDPTVVTVATPTIDAAGSGVDAALTFLKTGTVQLVAQGVDGSGNAIGSAQTVSLTLTPGPAAGLVVQVENEPPVAVPAPTPAPAPPASPTT